MSTSTALKVVSDNERMEGLAAALETSINEVAAQASELRAASAQTAADSLRKSTEKVIEVLEGRRNAQIEQINADYNHRRARDEARLIEVEAMRSEALRIAGINAEQAKELQQSLSTDAMATRTVIENETTKYNSMIRLQREILGKL
jgi:hypothetical protein